MHIIVKEFLNTGDNLSSIISKHYDKNQFLETIFYKIINKLNLDEVGEDFYLDLDRAIIEGHPDRNLYFLFISIGIRFTCFRKQLDRARVFNTIGSTLTRNHTPPILIAYFTMQMGYLKQCEGKSIERDQLLKEAFSLVDKKSPRYRSFVYLLASINSEDGRLKELEKVDLELIEKPLNEKQAIHCDELKLYNSVFNGDYHAGFRQLEIYKSKFKHDYYPAIIFNNLLKILSGDFDGTNYQQMPFPIIAKICQALSRGNIEDARNSYQVLKKTNYNKMITIPFLEYFPLHFELSSKNKGMSRLIYQEIRQNGKVHYFDDFFLARLQLLENNKHGAFITFKRLIENIKKYEAENRLNFEMQFAKELTSTDLLLLFNNTSIEPQSQTPKHKTELLVPSKIEKSIKLLIGESVAINEVKQLIKKFSKIKEPVLITGETGTGKELISRAIHEEGLHAKEPFLAINCGSLTETLLQSELFGYVAGAFTGAQKEHKGIFESVGKGTVLLDEFEEISPNMQVALLRVLESNEIRLIGGTTNRKIECKIVIATNVELNQMVKNKKFREDLLYRLNRFEIKLPPLRDRIQDIPKLVEYFLTNHYATNGVKIKISNNLLDALTKHNWPGNIRELKNEIERAIILNSDKEIIDIKDFDFTRLQTKNTDSPRNEIVIKPKSIKIIKPNIQELILDDEHILKIIESKSKAEIRLKCIKDLFYKYKKLTRSQIVKITLVGPGTVTKDLKILCKTGFIEKQTPTKSVKSHYFVLAK